MVTRQDVQDPGARPWLRAYPAGIDWAFDEAPATLTALIDEAVRRFGPRPALDFLGRRWNYAELGSLIDRAAAGFARLGAGPGTRIGLCLPNTPFFVIAFFAALKTGATVVNYNPLYTEEELAAQAADSGTSIMVTIDVQPIFGRVVALLGHGTVKRIVACRFHRALRPMKAAVFRVAKRRVLATVPRNDDRVVGFDALVAEAPIAAPPAVAPADLAVLQYTGGTTGLPKGVMLTHANLAANVGQMLRWFPQFRPGEERVLAVLPLFHVFAMTMVMNAGLARGAELVLLPRFAPAQLLAVLRRRRPTIFPGVPTLFKALLDHGAGRRDLSDVRLCLSGGAPLPLEIKHRFEQASGCTLVEGYGLTEASPVCFCNPVTEGNRAGTIGLPIPGVEAEIRALDDPTRRVPVGERGELVVRGLNVMQGYWQRPADTGTVLLPDGWLRTGDVGIMDADGYVTLVDRIKDLIIASGYKVYPRTVEEAIYQHPDIAAATVLGMPDSYRGESVAAFVQLRPGATLTEAGLRDFLRTKLSPIEMPRLIEIRAELPRTAVGKLSRKELREELLRRGSQ
ncbi:Long-chain fatty acid--CoA ligase [Rhodovastum atsumiense]|uniref:Long-chain fatty acid--CoA ligase n=1 Tax=Rhodovastum atsumiense TaxID=504468 RepID=A0A5M6ILA2_9PROT|nr:long-chain fatty acid--CoA ligase [Rhodovastum atsumiense]KAA5609050.1 long-chain fatty acid--CoA ligase [Rhodovastum atsumiense]CAH2604693.1 Long-chain fatty acid--CoA ligase [Rhodovastum atsumiense]